MLLTHYLLVSSANSLDPDQAGQNVWPDQDPKCLRWYSWNNFLKKLILKKIRRLHKSMKYFPGGRVNRSENIKQLFAKKSFIKWLQNIINQSMTKDILFFPDTVNVLKFRTLFNFCSQTKCWYSQNACQDSKQGRTRSACFFRSSLIWVCTVCLAGN